MTVPGLAEFYRRVADDAKAAAIDKDAQRFNTLTLLVIALERAYPQEMEQLRDEGFELETEGKDGT